MTMLLEEFAVRAQELDWEPALLELQPAHNTDEGISAALRALLDRTRQRLSRLARLRSAAGRALRSASLSLGSDEVHRALSRGSACRQGN